MCLTSKIRGELEDKLGVGATVSGKALVEAVDRLARLDIGTVSIPLTDSQWDELRHRADKRDTTVKDEISRIWNAIGSDLFWNA